MTSQETKLKKLLRTKSKKGKELKVFKEVVEFNQQEEKIRARQKYYVELQGITKNVSENASLLAKLQRNQGCMIGDSEFDEKKKEMKEIGFVLKLLALEQEKLAHGIEVVAQEIEHRREECQHMSNARQKYWKALANKMVKEKHFNQSLKSPDKSKQKKADDEMNAAEATCKELYKDVVQEYRQHQVIYSSDHLNSLKDMIDKYKEMYSSGLKIINQLHLTLDEGKSEQTDSDDEFEVPINLKKESTKLFGVSLKEVMSRKRETGPIPQQVADMLDYIHQESTLKTVGIFRVPGNQHKMVEYEKSLNEGAIGKELFKSEHGVHNICGLFKRYLRSLPEPLVTQGLYRKFVKFINTPEDERELVFDQLWNKLPQWNQNLIKSIVNMIIIVVSHSDENKMDIGNMSLVMGPNLLRSTQEDNPLLHAQTVAPACFLCKFMIDNSWILGIDNRGENILQQRLEKTINSQNRNSLRYMSQMSQMKQNNRNMQSNWFNVGSILPSEEENTSQLPLEQSKSQISQLDNSIQSMQSSCSHESELSDVDNSSEDFDDFEIEESLENVKNDEQSRLLNRKSQTWDPKLIFQQSDPQNDQYEDDMDIVQNDTEENQFVEDEKPSDEEIETKIDEEIEKEPVIMENEDRMQEKSLSEEEQNNQTTDIF